MERGAKPAKVKIETKARAATKSRKTDAPAGGQFEQRLAEALEQQEATSKILRVIRESPTDVQPVYEAIASAALRLFRASLVNVFRFDGELIHLAVVENANVNAEYFAAIHSVFPRPPGRDTAVGRTVLERSTIAIPDVLEDREYGIGTQTLIGGFRSILGVPLMREENVIGAITVCLLQPGQFPKSQVAVLQTFADQAVIAIENVRLFNETKEALERQSASAEVLAAISSSIADTEPVFDRILASCEHLFAGKIVGINVVGEDGLLRVAAYQGQGREEVEKTYPAAIDDESASGVVMIRREVLHLPDVDGGAHVPPATRRRCQAMGIKAAVVAPLLWEGKGLGSIFVGRDYAGPFSDNEIALLKTFADQAVIAIQNARLFNETKEALEQQTATSEILRVISQSPTDVQPVFDTIARAALALCRASSATLFTFDGELIRLATFANVNPEAADAVRLTFPRPPGRDTAVGRAVLTGRVVAIPDVLEDPEYAVKDSSVAAGFRSLLSVPLIRDKSPIGAISVGKPEPGLFPDAQVALLQTFADQAVIAIGNVRLFDEVQARTHDLTESLQQQTATADVLKVISRSTFDLQTVLDTLTESACKLCEADASDILRPDGDVFKVAAMFGQSPAHKAALKQLVIRPGRDTCAGRTLLEGRTVHIRDAALDPEYNVPDVLNVAGNRAMLGVPLLREGAPIGVLVLTRSVARPFTEKQIALATTFADQAVIAIENVRLFNETTEALEQQTATSEILRVISHSPTDVQPVFDAIAAAALKLCAASSATVFTFDGELIRIAALVNVSPEGADAVRRFYPRPPGRDNAASRAVLTCSVITIPDVLEDREIAYRDTAVASSFRSVLSVPLIRDGKPIGAISVGRPEPGPFPDKQIALLQTFADQAVIAIENARLFNETAEALEKQAAISEILQVISNSPGDMNPMLNAVVERAVKLCGAADATILVVEEEGLRSAARFSDTRGALEVGEFIPLTRGSVTGRAVVDRAVIHVEDLATASEEEFPVGRELQRRLGHHTALSVPLIREDRAIGAIALWRMEVRQFTDEQVALVKTFADQAAIAIENVRLFNETKEALERQTATSEILRVISQSPRDVRPVFDTIAAAALKLCGGSSATVARIEGQQVDIAALASWKQEAADAIRHSFPRPIGRDTAVTRAILTRNLVVIPDVLQDREYAIQDAAVAGGYRSALAVPLIREGNPIGSIAVVRHESGPFPDKQVVLLRTFADQAVIAIENVRLFKELEARTAQLTQSVGELRALGEVGQAVSSTLDLETVLSTIVSRATALAGMDAGAIYEYDELRGEFYLHTADRLPDEVVTALRAGPIAKGEGALGRMAMTGDPTQIHDIMTDASYQSRLRGMVLRLGYRSLMAVPLTRDDHLLGGLVVYRKTPGEFEASIIDLLKTFATQSALAIQNARLFREIEQKSRELEAASHHKSEFLANMSHELRTPLNAIIGFSEVLSERMFGEINEKQAEYIGDILDSGRHLLSLINDILDLSKIEAGRMELELNEFDLPGAIDNSLTLVRERAHRHGITLGRDVDERLGVVRADERKVKQVLLNLLSNALKFTPEGGRIDVRAAVRDSTAEISVTDTGVGIAPEDQDTVFEEFRQVGTAAKKVEGTGLGLAISRRFIELHGGRIWVKSQVGAGSTFTFTLPLQ